MKKKVLFCIASVATLLMASCFEETGYYQSQKFWRYVTIDTTSTNVRMIADCTGEVFGNKRIANVSSTEDLKQFGLQNAKRALVQLNAEIDASYNQRLTLLGGTEVEILPVTNQPIKDSTMHLAGLQSYYTNHNYAWVSEGYLNVMPIIPSAQSGKYYLTAESVAGDTLIFDLHTTNNKGTNYYYDKLQCFDLRTLRDTTEASQKMREKMIAVLDAMETHRRDSVRILLQGEYATKSIYTGRDTIVHGNLAMTNYFNYNF